MKVYVVNRENTGEHGSTDMVKIFSTLEKANEYVVEMRNKCKDNIGFQYGWYYWDVEEVEVE